ncbi:MAG: hypothetical protein JWO06_2608, partial [Bacteroidota bacterium]|nr:hypothetical protein [Bacteroidota bacterium]
MNKDFYRILPNVYRFLLVFALVSVLWHNEVNAACGSTLVSGSSPQTSVNTGAALTWSQSAQRYVQVTSVVNGGVYTISSAVGTDYFTIRTTDANTGTVVASGVGPLTFTSTATTVYVVLNTNAACGTDATARNVTMAAKPVITSVPASACAGSLINIT